MQALRKQKTRPDTINRATGVLKGALLSLSILFSLPSSAEPTELKIYNWAEYFPMDLIARFEKENDVKVVYDTFESAEQQVAKLMVGNSGYDLTFPSASTLQRMIQAGALEKIDMSLVPQLSNIDPSFMAISRKQGDTHNEYAVPYLWGTTLIGYNKDMIKKATGKDHLTGWSDLLEVDSLKKLQDCGVTILDSESEVLPIVLSYLGMDPNSTNPDDYKKAGERLNQLRPYIRSFNSLQYMTDLATGDICAAIGWSGSILVSENIARDNGTGMNIDMALPEEGAPVWFDTMAIPVGARHPDLAAKFINFVLQPDVIAAASNEIGYANPNLKATPLVDASLTSNPNIYISPDLQQSLFPMVEVPLKIERIRTRLWSNFKTGR